MVLIIGSAVLLTAFVLYFAMTPPKVAEKKPAPTGPRATPTPLIDQDEEPEQIWWDIYPGGVFWVDQFVNVGCVPGHF